MQLLLEVAKPYNDMFFISFDYFDCTEKTVRLWICRMKWKINLFSISFTSFRRRSARRKTEEEYEELVRRIHFVTSEEGIFDVARRSLVRSILSLNDEREQRCEGIQNRSCQQIWGRHHGYVCRIYLKTEDNTFLVRTLVFEMIPRFSNTQTTYLNKQTMSWCKDFLWRHVFFDRFFVKLTERCQHATPHRQQGP